MNEADLSIVFSQFGEITDISLSRDPATGKPMGFAFLAYENQKSTILAIDNMNGTVLCGRPICVDHIKEFKPPKITSEEGEVEDFVYKPSGPDGKGWGDYRKY